MIGRHSCTMKFATEMCCDLCCKTYKCTDNVRAGLNLKEIHKQKLKGVLHPSIVRAPMGVAGAGPFAVPANEFHIFDLDQEELESIFLIYNSGNGFSKHNLE